MTATLPSELRDVFERSSTAELVTIDDSGRPRARAVRPAYRQGGVCIDIAPGQSVRDPRVALLFAETDLVVLVQGTAQSEGLLHVRPERVYAWSPDDPDGEPRLFDAHLEEVRSGHNEEPEIGHVGPEGGRSVWEPSLDEVDSGLLACVGPDGFPFAVRLAVSADPGERVLRLVEVPLGLPIEPGPACLHAGDARVEGDLVAGPDGWGLVPHRLLGARASG
jgi:Pyridoxamine 5'-phosphate oxidase